MIRAVDNNGSDILIWSANKGEQYYCPVCHQPLIQRRGEINKPHFAHTPSRDGVTSGCSDRWNYDKTDWHIDWQRRFPEECFEKVVNVDGKRHIADIQINDLVIEFQHSQISIDEFRERNSFYKGAGFHVVWVFDVIDDWEKGKIDEADNPSNMYTWANAKKVFRTMDVKHEEATIYFQFLDGEDDDIVLERVTGGYRNFSQFYTDLNNALSISEFIEKAKEANSSLIPRKQEPTKSPESVSNGYSIFDLWKHEYAYMIVLNLNTQKKMIIFGNDGEMDHQYGDPKKVMGKYIQSSSGQNVYSPKKYVVWDAEKAIWAFVHAKYKEVTPL